MKNIENLFDKDLNCRYRDIRYLVLFCSAEGFAPPGARVVVKCNIVSSEGIVVYSETPTEKVGNRRCRKIINDKEFLDYENVFKTYGAALNYMPSKPIVHLDAELKCPLKDVRYVVMFYSDAKMLTHQKQIVKFDRATGNGIVVRDDLQPELVGKKMEIYVGDDVDQLDNVFDSLTKAEKYSYSGESVCPESGSFEAYKVAVRKDGTHVLVMLRIPEEAARVSVFFKRICRCDCAEVLSITGLDDGAKYKKCRSFYDRKFKYKVGEMVRSKGFCADRREWCGEGISFFMTADEARDYYTKGGAVPW